MCEVASFVLEKENATRWPSGENDGCRSAPRRLASGDTRSSMFVRLIVQPDQNTQPATITAATAMLTTPRRRYARRVCAKPSAGVTSNTRDLAASAALGRAGSSFASILMTKEAIAGGTSETNSLMGVGSHHTIA